MKNLKRFIKKKKKAFIVGVFLVVLLFFVFNSFRGNGEELYDIYKIEYGDVSQEVTETGIVRPGQTVDLAFKAQEKVESVSVKVGDRVVSGQELIRLEQGKLRLNVSRASAVFVATKTKLDKLIAGVTEEDKQVYLTTVLNAEIALANKKQALEDVKSDADSDLNQVYEDMGTVLSDSYLKGDNAVRNNIDQLFDNPRGSSPQVNFSMSDSKLESSIENQRLLIEEALKEWKDSLIVLGDADADDLDDYISTALKNLSDIKYFLNDVALAVNSLVAQSNLSQTTIDAWKLDVSTARTSINTAITNLVNQGQAIETTKITNQTSTNTAQAVVDTANSSLKIAEDKLAQIMAPPRPEDLLLAQAEVRQAEATLAISREDLRQSVITAPFDGVVTDISIEVGETVSIGGVVVSVDSKDKFQIEADIYEEDIPWVDVGDLVKIEIVAFPDKIFEGSVVSVEPAEKMVGGVVYYEVKIGINKGIEGIKNGMTTDVTIITDSKNGVLLVPRKAVNKRNGKSMVEILRNELMEDLEISVGLKGSNDMLEVVSGLKEGDEVIVR